MGQLAGVQGEIGGYEEFSFGEMWKRNPKGEKVLEVLKQVVRIDPFPAYGLECGQSTCRATHATPHE